MDDILKRLEMRDIAAWDDAYSCRARGAEAAARIRELEAENATLREARGGMSKHAYSSIYNHGFEAGKFAALEPAPVTVGDDLEPIDRALRHIEACLTFPVSTQIDKRGYSTRTPTPETVQYIVDELFQARAALRALADAGEAG